MMGRLDWVGTWFAMHGHQHPTSAFISKADEIMSKYRPIAPKPSLQMPSNLCKSTSDSDSAHFRSPFSTAPMANNTANGGHYRSGPKRRASDSSKSPSPRVPKRARGPNISPTDERSTHNLVGTSMTVDGPKLACPADGSFSTEKLTIEKDSVFMKTATATDRSVLQQRSAGFEGPKIKAVANSSDGEVGVENPATKMEVSENQCDCRSTNYFVFPIVSNIQQQLQEMEKNPVTLPLLPQSPSLHSDSVLGSSSSTSTSSYDKPDMLNTFCDKKEIRLRVFGRDLSHKVVGASQMRTDESPKPINFVPIVGLSFL